jgi:hypothetical protein
LETTIHVLEPSSRPEFEHHSGIKLQLLMSKLTKYQPYLKILWN